MGSLKTTRHLRRHGTPATKLPSLPVGACDISSSRIHSASTEAESSHASTFSTAYTKMFRGLYACRTTSNHVAPL